MYLYSFLALICIIKTEKYDRPFLIDFNIDVFSQGLSQLLNVKDSLKWNIFVWDII